MRSLTSFPNRRVKSAQQITENQINGRERSRGEDKNQMKKKTKTKDEQDGIGRDD